MQQFIDLLEEFSAKIFTSMGLAVQYVECGCEELCADGEEVVAVIAFTGDFDGEIALVLRPAQIEAIVGGVCAKFGIKTEVLPVHVFSELINIYGGNLVTAVEKKLGKRLAIGLPCKEAPAPGNHLWHSVRMFFDGELTAKLGIITKGS